jgi:predicted XRE-type DNA-binding protein
MTRTAVYRHYAADGSLLYVGLSANPTRRLSEHNSRSGRREEVARIDLDWFDSKDAAIAAEAQAIRELKPRDNVTGPRFKREAPNALAQYLADVGMTQTEFAELMGINQATVSKLCGKKIPSFPLAIRIHEKTGGKVPVTSWEEVR